MSVVRRCDVCDIDLTRWGAVADEQCTLKDAPPDLGPIRVMVTASLVRSDGDVPDLCPRHELELVRQVVHRLTASLEQ